MNEPNVPELRAILDAAREKLDPIAIRHAAARAAADKALAEASSAQLALQAAEAEAMAAYRNWTAGAARMGAKR